MSSTEAESLAQSPLYERVYALVAQVPRGQVVTYGQVARWAGYPGRARQVGHALFRLQGTGTAIPWQRVINAQGQVSYSPHRQGYDDLQVALLRAEGVVFDAAGRIDLARYGWHP